MIKLETVYHNIKKVPFFKMLANSAMGNGILDKIPIKLWLSPKGLTSLKKIFSCNINMMYSKSFSIPYFFLITKGQLL